MKEIDDDAHIMDGTMPGSANASMDEFLQARLDELRKLNAEAPTSPFRNPEAWRANIEATKEVTLDVLDVLTASRRGPGAKFTVYVDDNYHFMDEDERYTLGVFDSEAAAVAAAQKVVDDCLLRLYTPGESAQQLLDSYKFGGDDPWISPFSRFSAWDYAAQRCQELCGDKLPGFVAPRGGRGWPQWLLRDVSAVRQRRPESVPAVGRWDLTGIIAAKYGEYLDWVAARLRWERKTHRPDLPDAWESFKFWRQHAPYYLPNDEDRQAHRLCRAVIDALPMTEVDLLYTETTAFRDMRTHALSPLPGLEAPDMDYRELVAAELWERLKHRAEVEEIRFVEGTAK